MTDAASTPSQRLAAFNALKPTATMLDPRDFANLAKTSAALQTSTHLDVLVEHMQRQGVPLTSGIIGDLCALLVAFPTFPKAQVVVGMLTQKTAQALPEMSPRDAAAVFAVFAAAGPLGDAIVVAAVERIASTVAAASADDVVLVADTLSSVGPARCAGLVPLIRDQLVARIAAASATTASSLVRCVLHPLFFDDTVRDAVISLLKPDSSLNQGDDVERLRFTHQVVKSLNTLQLITERKQLAPLLQAVRDSLNASTFASVQATTQELSHLIAASCQEMITLDMADTAAVTTLRDVLGATWAAVVADSSKAMKSSEESALVGSVLAVLTQLAATKDVVEKEVVVVAERLLEQGRRNEPVTAASVAALIHPATMNSSASGDSIVQLMDAFCDGWNVSEWAVVLAALGKCGADCATAREFGRRHAASLASAVLNATPEELGAVAAAIGHLQVRVMSLSTAIADRCCAVRESATPRHLAEVFSALTRLDARLPKPFLECVPQIRRHTAATRASDAAAFVLAYARHNVWLYKVYARLADRLTEIDYEWTVLDMKRALAGFHRVDLKHAEFTSKCVARVLRDFDDMPLPEAVALTGAVTKAGGWDARLFEKLDAALTAASESLDADLLGDALMCYARVGYSSTPVFDSLALRAIGLAPTASALAIANILTAYAAMRIQNTELFTVYGERTLTLKNDCPAVTIASVLTAFSTVGLKDDKLFIEMIPRVRFVAHHGTPQDVANVLTSYTAVGLWHYKLFVRLAERAIQVRAECTAEQVSQILFAFAKVEMKYEKLFIDFSPRVQTLAATALPSHLAAYAHSYAAVRAYDLGVLNAVADRAIQTVGAFEVEEAKLLLRAFVKLSTRHPRLFEVFKSKFGDELGDIDAPAEGPNAETVGAPEQPAGDAGGAPAATAAA
jgi:hypothetical protein